MPNVNSRWLSFVPKHFRLPFKDAAEHKLLSARRWRRWSKKIDSLSAGKESRPATCHGWVTRAETYFKTSDLLGNVIHRRTHGEFLALISDSSELRQMDVLNFFSSSQARKKTNKQIVDIYFLLSLGSTSTVLRYPGFDNPSSLTNHRSELSSLIPLNSTKRSKSNWKLLFLFLSPARDTTRTQLALFRNFSC